MVPPIFHPPEKLRQPSVQAQHDSHFDFCQKDYPAGIVGELMRMMCSLEFCYNFEGMSVLSVMTGEFLISIGLKKGFYSCSRPAGSTSQLSGRV